MEEGGLLAYENPQNCRPSLQTRDAPFFSSSARSLTGGWPWGGHLARSPQPGPQAPPTPTPHPLPPITPIASSRSHESWRSPAGWRGGARGQTVSTGAEHSTSLHSGTRVTCTAGPRVDSALNSFGIAGRSHPGDRGGGGGEGRAATPWRGRGGRGRTLRMMLKCTERNRNCFSKSL